MKALYILLLILTSFLSSAVAQKTDSMYLLPVESYLQYHSHHWADESKYMIEKQHLSTFTLNGIANGEVLPVINLFPLYGFERDSSGLSTFYSPYQSLLSPAIAFKNKEMNGFYLYFENGVEYNFQSSLNPDFLSYKGGRTDFLGFDDGTRNLASSMKEKILQMEEAGEFWNLEEMSTVEELNQLSSTFNKTYVPQPAVSFINKNHSLSFGDSLGKKSAYHFSYAYKRDYTSWDRVYRDSLINHQVGEIETALLVHLGIEHKINDKNELGIHFYSLNQSSNYATKYTSIYPQFVNKNIWRQTTLGFDEKHQNIVDIQGRHFLSGERGSQLVWSTRYIHSLFSDPDHRVVTDQHRYTGDYYTSYTPPFRSYFDYHKNFLSAQAELILPLKKKSEKQVIKAGLKTFRSVQNRDVYFVNLDGDWFHNYNGNIEPVLDHVISNENYPDGKYIFYDVDNYLRAYYNYDGSSTQIESYLQYKHSLFQKLHFEATLKLVHLDIQTTYHPKKPSTWYLKSDYKEGFLLPDFRIDYLMNPKIKAYVHSYRHVRLPNDLILNPAERYNPVLSNVYFENPSQTYLPQWNTRMGLDWNCSSKLTLGILGYYNSHKFSSVYTFSPPVYEEGIYEQYDDFILQNLYYGKSYGGRFIIDYIIDNQSQNYSLGFHSVIQIQSVDVDSTLHISLDENLDFKSPIVDIKSSIRLNQHKMGVQVMVGMQMKGETLAFVAPHGPIRSAYLKQRWDVFVHLQKQFGKHFIVQVYGENLLNQPYHYVYIDWYSQEQTTWRMVSTGALVGLKLAYKI